MNVRVLSLGDAALTVATDAAVEPALTLRILGIARTLLAERDAGGLVGVTDVMPAFRSLTVCFDPARLDRDALAARLRELFVDDRSAPPAGRRWRLPVCYDRSLAGDLDELSGTLGVAPEEIAAQHAATEYAVLVIGFLPGFPYLGPLPERLRLPRRRTPHLRVPAGSVAIANQYSAIYPWESPGGWHLIGRTPVPLFDPAADPPSTLQAGDRVRFQPVTLDGYRQRLHAAQSGDLDLAEFLVESGP